MPQTQAQVVNVTRILVMEDDLNIARGLATVLGDEEYSVRVAGDGQSAIDAFKEEDFDLLIADIRLPDMNGLDVIKQVRHHSPDTKIIVITGFVSTSVAVDAMHNGVADFLPKPFSEQQILKSVKSTLQQREGHRDAYVHSISETDRLIQKKEVLQVLDRTNEDQLFCYDLTKKGAEALSEYALSDEAKEAIVNGDLDWINKNVGELTQKQLKYVFERTQKKDWQL
ncbi:response regulator [Desulforhopalus sp. IMCC35007]|uniref:response regulator n=1 Tax=Desulforhopalus sp. IMCC35007 TaxID=2569543 RepID=UPI0010AEDAD2|nr:response regulator [Desulforhopalus sp. IMCC35007]TKB10065.1 response regulator [Desulforhopalus sp. IMCC35007]